MDMAATQNGDTAKPATPLPIGTLLKDLRPTIQGHTEAEASDIAAAVSKIFTNELSPVQAALLLYTLSLTGLEHRPDVLARCATVMRNAAVPIDGAELNAAVRREGKRVGEYHGGLVW